MVAAAILLKRRVSALRPQNKHSTEETQTNQEEIKGGTEAVAPACGIDVLSSHTQQGRSASPAARAARPVRFRPPNGSVRGTPQNASAARVKDVKVRLFETRDQQRRT
jgi:hypothetical protein